MTTYKIERVNALGQKAWFNKSKSWCSNEKNTKTFSDLVLASAALLHGGQPDAYLVLCAPCPK